MKKGIALFSFCIVLLIFVACVNQHHGDSIVWKKGESGLAGNGNHTDKPDGPMIEQNGAFVELGPTGLSEETILIQLSDSSTPSPWSPETHTMEKYLGKDVTSIVGFGQLRDDINNKEENFYAVSFLMTKQMWLHITVGTNIDGVFKQGVLIDFFGNEWKVTKLTFTFFRRNRENRNYNTKQPIDDIFQNNTASGQISSVKSGPLTTHPITNNGANKNIQLKLRVVAEVEDKNGYTRTLNFERFCGAKSHDVPVPSFGQMFG